MADADRRANEREAASGDREKTLAVRRDRCRSGECCAHAPASLESFAVAKLPTLWYENENGQRWLPSREFSGDPPPPEGFIYQHARFPRQLTHSILRITQASEVASCEHSEEHIRPTGGWIEGIRGRRCLACQGTQTGPVNEDWPEEWDAHGSQQIMRGNMGWSQELVHELVKHGNDVGDAALFAAIACERCMNIAAWRVGLHWGYASDSEEAAKAGTTCELCQPEPTYDG